MRRILTTTAVTAVLVLAPTATAWAANPHPGGSGQPNQDCTSFSASTRPGNSASSPGAPFNEPGINSANGGTGGNAYNAAGAPSQYDVACFQASQHH
jgi:hypothetical protein